MPGGRRIAPPEGVYEAVRLTARPCDTDAATALVNVTELIAAIRALERRLRQQSALRASTARSASPAEHAVLRCLADADGPLSLVALAGRIARDQGSACVLVQRLHARRLVQKWPDPTDGRRLQISVTAAGRRAADEVLDDSSSALAHALAAWPAGRVEAAAALLAQLTEALPTMRSPGVPDPSRTAPRRRDAR